MERTLASAQVQMAISPYEVLLHVVWESLGHYWPTPSARWRSAVREDRRLDARPLAVLHPASRLVPDWMSPPPAVGDNTLAETLRRIRATPAPLVEAGIRELHGDRPPAELVPYLDAPGPALERLARAIEDFWDKHLSFRWPMARAIVEREVALVGASLPTQPAHEALSRLHPRVGFTEDELLVHGSRSTVRAPVADRRVLLVPTVAADEALGISFDQPGVVHLAYPARGAAELWRSRAQAHEGELRALLGDLRAEMLIRLRTPNTTSALARALQSSPAGVSFHLQALVRMGLVDKLRRGRQVFYRHTGRGAALVALFLDA